MFEPSLLVVFMVQDRSLASSQVSTWNFGHSNSDQRLVWSFRTGTLEKGTEDLAMHLLNDLGPVLPNARPRFSHQ